MKSTAPWSVKGITKDTREAAKEAARREGKTLGEWLNKLIAEAGEHGISGMANDNGVDVNEIVDALDHLNRKVRQNDNRLNETLAHLTSALVRVEERLNTEQHAGDTGADFGPWEARFTALEEKVNDRERIHALRALEKAVGQMAVQVEKASQTTETRLDENDDRFARIEETIRTLGEPGSDPALSETVSSLARSLDAVKTDLAQAKQSTGHLDESQASAEFAKLGNSLADIRGELSALKQAMPKTDSRLNTLEAGLQTLQQQFQDAADETARAQISALEQKLPALDHEVEEIKTALPDIRDTLAKISTRLDVFEDGADNKDDQGIDPEFAERTGKRLRVLGDEIKRGGDQVRSLETLISRLSDQIDSSENRNAEALQKLGERLESLDGQLHHLSAARAPEAAGPSLAALTTEIDRSVRESTDALQSLFDSRLEDLENHVHELRASGAALPARETDDEELEVRPHFGMRAARPDAPVQATEAGRGSLDEEDDPLVVSEDHHDEFSGAFEDLDFEDDETPPTEAGSTAQPVEIDLDAEEHDANEARRIANEINLALNGMSSDDSASDQEVSAFDPSQDDLTEPDGFDDLGSDAAEDDVPLFDYEVEAPEPPPLAAPNPGPQARGSQSVAQPSQQPEDGRQAFLAASETLRPHHPDNSVSDPLDRPGERIAEPRSGARAAADAPGEAPPTPATASSADDGNSIAGDHPGKLPRTPDGRIDVARLTPKQKAILVARAKRKKAAAEQADMAPQKRRSEDQPAPGDTDARSAVHKEQQSLFAKIKNHFGGTSLLEDEDSEAPAKKKVAAGADNLETAPTIDDAGAEERLARTDDRNASALSGLVANPLVRIAILGLLIIAALIFLGLQFLGGKNTGDKTPAPSPGIDRPDVPSPKSATGNRNTELPAIGDRVRPRESFLSAMAILNADPEGDVAQAAFQNLEQSAMLGYPPAQFQLGEFYKDGKFTDADPARARSWFQRAANGGNLFAMHRLGYLYAEGKGGSTDMPAAIRWFEQAANLGFVDSQFNLGAIYDPGLGNEPRGIQDIEKSYYWFALAARNGDSLAAEKADEIEQRLSRQARERLNRDVQAWQAEPVNAQANEDLVSAP